MERTASRLSSSSSKAIQLPCMAALFLSLCMLAGFPQPLEASEPVLTTIYRVQPKKCPVQLADGPSLSFVDGEPPHLVVLNRSTPFECRRVIECKVLTSPSESNVYWYHNNKLVQATTFRDMTLSAMANTDTPPQTLLGLSQMTHRLCVDPFLASPHGNGGGSSEFKCRIQSLCELNESIESEPIVVQANEGLRARRVINDSPARRAIPHKAPLISMIQSTRMELAGNFVQLMCNAVGTPKPVVQWRVLDESDESVSYPLDQFPFIWAMANGDLLVDSSKTQLGSIGLECTAKNPYGSDSATSTLILLNEN